MVKAAANKAMANQRRKRSKPATVDDRRPSKVHDAYWLCAERKFGEYPEHAERGGKWLIFVPVVAIDEVWARIRDATERGILGGSAKASTARPNPNAADPKARVICVYTYDCTDEKDVMRVRAQLRSLGITAKIPYKADDDTFAGKYSKRGDKRISRYYE